MSRRERAHRLIERWFREALQAVDPRRSVQRSLEWDGANLRVAGREVDIREGARLVVIAIGKAAPDMAQGAVDVLGERIDDGFILTKEGHPRLEVAGFEAREASHPVPGERGLAATREILNLVGGLSGDDVVLALISGGGSALLEQPRDGVSLADMQQATELLMHAGAGIHDLNVVRQALSEVKGGGLRRAIGPARSISLLLSDVLGNDLHVIASGPTVPLPRDLPSAVDVARRYGLDDQVPPAVMRLLEGPRPDGMDPDPRDIVLIIADNATLIDALARIAREASFTVGKGPIGYDGDATELGLRLVREARDARREIDVLLGGGEATVRVTGTGVGGRNTEAALAAAMAMTADDDWVIASLASDGDDGVSHAAGAIADAGTVERGRNAGVDARRALENNDSATFFSRAGGLVVTGATGTNVNDVYIAVRLGDRVDQEFG